LHTFPAAAPLPSDALAPDSLSATAESGQVHQPETISNRDLLLNILATTERCIGILAGKGYSLTNSRSAIEVRHG
jgi:hypothetical protein